MKKVINTFATLMLSGSMLLGHSSSAQVAFSEAKEVAEKNVFIIERPDLARSPYTGMSREHWKAAALYLLEGAFGYIRTLEDPMKFPKLPGKSYPLNEEKVPTEKLEGLCRTLFIAAPLLKEDPGLEIGGIKVADYYRHQLLSLINPQSPAFIPHRAKNGGPNQNLVEFGALAISLFVAPEVLWKPLTQQQKDRLAATMLSYGDGPTVDSNWKFFNIFVLSFFKEQGYAVNDKLLEEYLQRSLTHYRGYGWYNDSPAYDFYSMWAFQLYGMLWTELVGREHYPQYAAQFEKNFSELYDSYPYLFSEGGQMMMWGRSISYRFASVSPFPLLAFARKQDVNWGWMRQISSGTLMQFLQHPEFLKDGVPTLGFYGHFEPAVQVYSCRGSVYWMGKAFLALLVPPDHPFWTATENKGPWEEMAKEKQVYHRFQPGSNILITNYPAIGAAEVRAWCHEKVADDWQQFRSSENYNRLSYNTAFPWQADGPLGQAAMNYAVKNKEEAWEATRLYTFKRFEEGVYYRDVVLETNENIKLNLADMPLPNGILRIDRNASTQAAAFRLGHYALPRLGQPIRKEDRQVKGYQVKIIDNGRYQLALVSLSGWDMLETSHALGLHPEAKESVLLNVSDRFTPKAGEAEIYATLMLWKKSGEAWTDKELLPLKKISFDKSGKAVKLSLHTGEQKVVRFE